MPAESKKQQRFFGMVHAVQKGELSPTEVGPAIRKAARNTEYSDVKDFASTKHKNLPEKRAAFKKAKEILKKIKGKGSFKNIDDEDGENLLLLGGAVLATGGGAGVVSSKLTEKKGSVQMKYFEKVAKDEPGYWGKQMAASRAARDTGDGINKVITSKEYQKDYYKDMFKGIAPGAAIGAVPGVAAGALFTSRFGKKALGVGAFMGGLLGADVGATYGAMKGQKKYYAKKGIDVSMWGNVKEMTPEAKKKYLDKKYRGGGHKS